MQSDLEQRFHDMMVGLYWETGKVTKGRYWPNRFLQKVRNDRGLPAAKGWLKASKGITPGLERVAKEGLLELSLEYIVLQEPWRQLFTPEELQVAQQRLDDLEQA